MQPVIPLVLAGLLLLGVAAALAVARMVGGQHAARPGCALPFAELLRRIKDEGRRGPGLPPPDHPHPSHPRQQPSP
jgi:hypothetical protein